jgi:voltage-gated sodium channel
MYGSLHHLFMGIIVCYAIFLGFQGTSFDTTYYQQLKVSIDQAFLTCFIVELGLKIMLNPKEFFQHKWHFFELGFLILSLYVPGILVLRIFRFFTYLYTFFEHPLINRVIHTFLKSFSTLLISTGVLIASLVGYALLTTTLFGHAFPEKFSHLGKSLFTFCRLITFDDWMASVLEPVMEVYPYSWIIFFSFVIVIVFGIMNIFIGTIVNAMRYTNDPSDDNEPSNKEIQQHIEELKKLILKDQKNRNVDQ